ncbi:MAG: hypothetical protein A4S12_07630 [Proteobacteria bacterium SG_bin5]|nr:plasmid recombination protein [Hyphomicrobiales bacterium]MBX9815097.1 plasmid recombination protein [Sphingomonas sp.]OQW41854.1 MAG: hypothetical protein A4S12_07630 [Proteobacteria bacterium SG_bin5]
MFAIVTFRSTGPIKSWAAIRAANIHNSRTKPLPHAVPGAPPPMHLIGTGSLEADVRSILRDVLIDPNRLRKNGVLAFEAVLTASPKFFEQGSEADRQRRLNAWIKAQRDWAVQQYGLMRVASLVVHLDEKTPHAHLVVVPLEMKIDKRRRDGRARYSIVGRLISGPGAFDAVQDSYAAAMAPFGLRRGMRGSGRKNEPAAHYLKRLAEREEEAVRRLAEADARLGEARRAAQNAHLRERCLEWDRESFRLQRADERQKLREERAALERLKQEHAERIATEEARLARRAAELERIRLVLESGSARLEQEKARLRPVFEKANEFLVSARGVSATDFAPAAGRALTAARALKRVVEAASPGPHLGAAAAAQAAESQRGAAL